MPSASTTTDVVVLPTFMPAATTGDSTAMTSNSSGASLATFASAPAVVSSASQEKPQLLRKASLATRMLRKFSSGNGRRRSSDDSSQASQLSLPVRVPATIPEQTELTKEQLEAALRNEQIEQAASERDEKRKRRVKEALNSMVRRFEAAYNSITAEMDETVDTSKWTLKERNTAWAVAASLVLMLLVGITWPACIICLALMGYSHRSLKLRNFDARQAADTVMGRLDDLEDGIRRCALAVQHDLEADAEWEQSMKDEQRVWEERQRELHVKRGRTLHQLNTRRKRIVEQIRHLPENLPDKVSQTARSLLDKTIHRHQAARTARSASLGGQDVGPIETDPGASQAWVKYVHTNLPLERASHETEDEIKFAGVLRQKTEGKWDEVPHDLQLMVLRGYAEKKDRLKESLDAVTYILEWRAHCQADDMLRTATEEARVFFHAWQSRFGGEDRYGHLLVYDRVTDLDLHTLFKLTDDQVLTMRTKQMEVLRRLKKNTEDRRGHRVCKHIYMLDLSGLSVRDHFTPRLKHLLQSIFKVGGDAYPDSLWSLWLLNTPMVFQVIWKILAPTIDTITKSKIRMVGGKDKYIPEMERSGIPRASIPVELGGDHVSTNFFAALQDMIADRDRTQSEDMGATTALAAPEGASISAISIAQEEE